MLGVISASVNGDDNCQDIQMPGRRASSQDAKGLQEFLKREEKSACYLHGASPTPAANAPTRHL